MDHNTHIRLTDTDLTERTVAEAVIYGPDDEVVGHISHLHGSGKSAQAVIEVGGFLGIGSKQVSISLAELDMMRDPQGKVHGTTSLTKDQLKALPAHSEPL
jgi:hypothetical protein